MRMIIPEDDNKPNLKLKQAPVDGRVPRQRVGAIRLQGAMIWSNLPLMHEVFAELRFIPLRTQHILECDEMVLTGVSPRFEEVECGKIIPKQYAVNVKTKSDGTLLEVIVSSTKT